jgi:hypothetical protein
MVPQRHLARMAPYHLSESLGGGVEVTPGGVKGGMAEQGLQLDHVALLQNQASPTSEALSVDEPFLAVITVHTGSPRSGSP